MKGKLNQVSVTALRDCWLLRQIDILTFEELFHIHKRIHID